MNRFQQTTVAFSIIAAFYLGLSFQGTGIASFSDTANASDGSVVAGIAADGKMLFTSSSDGKTIYVWRYQGMDKPRYQGSVHAVVEE
ncbi:MAG: hypothetical protein AAGG44_11240 [Planctomycetota bacterium]